MEELMFWAMIHLKKKLANDIEVAWRKANVFYHSKDV